MNPRSRIPGSSLLSIVLALGGPAAATAATCHHPRGHVELSPLGDVNGSGVVNVADALCASLAVVNALAGDPLPACVAPAWAAVGLDLDCTGTLQVSDVLLVVTAALGVPFSAVIDGDGDGCPDACAPCAPPGGGSCFIDAQCVPEGAPQPEVECRVCAPAQDDASWVVAPELAPCAGGDWICLDGECVPAEPSEPTAVQAIAGDGRATVTFSPPVLAGSSPVVGYQVEVSPGGAVIAAAGPPIEVMGLDNDTAYTFRVRALNDAGPSPWSEPTEPVTPLMCLGEPDGAPCDDGDACTQVDTCQAEGCQGSSPVVCVPASVCHEVGVCDPATGACSTPPRSDGSPCDDGSGCTGEGQCLNGVCDAPSLCDPFGACVPSGEDEGESCACPAGAVDVSGDGSECAFLASCSDVRLADPGAGTGLYAIDPDGPGGADPYAVYCEQSLSGGGWTLLYTSSDDGQPTFTWNQRTLFSTDTTTVGAPDEPHRDFKSPALHDLPFQRLLFVHSPSGVWAEYAVDSQGMSFGELMDSISFPQCPSSASAGYPMVAGTLTAAPTTPGLCDTDLYFHLGDHDGGGIRVSVCQNLNANYNNATYGPAWNTRNNGGCHFDDPSNFSTGPAYPCVLCSAGTADAESNGRGYGGALSLNTGASGQAENFIQVYARALVGETASLPGRSCRDVLTQRPGVPSGEYWLDPDGAPHDDAFLAYCDMTTKGGGWTRLYYKSGPGTCFKIGGVTWTPTMIDGLDYQDFAVSSAVSTLNVDQSWMVYDVTHSQSDPLVRLARLANCQTPTGTAWSQSYTGGYLHFVGTLDTAGTWTSMFGGCTNTFFVGSGANFRAGGGVSHSGEFIHSVCNNYSTANNSITSRWDWNDTRSIWVR